MRWPDLVVRAQVKRVARDVTLDIRKKVFVGRDAESRRPALPFDFECSAGVDLGEGANCSVLCFDVAVASNSHPSASNGQHDARSQKYKNDLLHGKYDCASYDATAPRFGFKKNRCFLRSFKRGVVVATALFLRASWQRAQRLDAARTATKIRAACITLLYDL